MQIMKKIKIFVITQGLIVLSLTACNSGSNVSNVSHDPIVSQMSLHEFASELQYTPLTGNASLIASKMHYYMNGGLNLSPESSQYTFFVPITTTFSGIAINYYNGAGCHGDVVFVSSASGRSTFLAGLYNTTDKSIYTTCSKFGGGLASDQNCANEESVVRSIQYVFAYTAPAVGTVAVCLSNSKNTITGQPGDFYANYEIKAACTKAGTACGFSQGYFTPVYSQNSLVLESPINTNVMPGQTLTAAVDLIGIAGVTKQYIAAIAINNRTGESIPVLPDVCILQSESAPFATKCSFNVTPSNGVSSGEYTLQFVNLNTGGSVAFIESTIPFSVTYPAPQIGMSVSESKVFQAGTLAVTASLQGPEITGVTPQALSATVTDSTGAPVSNIAVTGCTLQSTTSPYAESCSLSISPSETTPTGVYTLHFTNSGSLAFIQNTISFNVVVPYAGFTVTNQSYLQTMVISNGRKDYGHWSCNGSAIDPVSYTLNPESSAQCTLTQTGGSINEAWNIADTSGRQIGSMSYQCTAGGSTGYACNESMSAFQFSVNAPLGIVTASDQSSVTFDSPACPTATQLNSLINGASGSGSFNYDNQSWMVMSSTSLPATNFSNAQIVQSIVYKANCFYTTSQESQPIQIQALPGIDPGQNAIYFIKQVNSGYWRQSGPQGYSCSNADSTLCQFMFQ